MSHARIPRQPAPRRLALLALLLCMLSVSTAPAQPRPKHTSAPHQPTHQYLAGQALELLKHDPASPPEMLVELAASIGQPIVDWCFWKSESDRFNFTYGGKESHSQTGAKENRCRRADGGFAVPYADYTAAQWQGIFDNDAETVGTDGNDLIEGAQEEDHYDPLRDVYAGPLSACNFFLRHFWEPDSYDDGLFDEGLVQVPGCPLPPAEATGSAVNKAEIYWTRAKTAYFLGDKELAYYYLGRVVHLLEDLSSTPHTHNDPHPDLLNDDEFEEYMGRKSGDWDDNPLTGEVDPAHFGFDNNYLRWGWSHTTNASLRLTPVDPENLSEKVFQEWYGSRHQHRGQRQVCDAPGPCVFRRYDDDWPAWAFGHAQANPARARLELYSRSSLFRIFYSLAEITDDFPSDSRDGDNPAFDRDNDGFDIREDRIVAYANTIMPAAIEHIAGLYRLFWTETNFPASPSAMLILLDRTGSMREVRPATGNSRCRDALTIAREDARSFFAGGGANAAIWAFSGAGIENLTSGFTGETGVMAAFDGLSPEGCDGSTPLADAICAASDALAAGFPKAPHGSKVLAISSDGGENSSTGRCSGPDSTTSFPYDEGSWQHKTRETVLRQSNVLVRFWNALSKRAVDLETGRLTAPSDSEFFAELAETAGGTSFNVDDNGDFPPPFTAIPDDPSCPAGLILDDGSFENGFASSDAFTGTAHYAMRFTTGAPTILKSVCVCFTQRNRASTLPFTFSVMDDDGPQGTPGTLLGQVSSLAASVPTFPEVRFYKLDLGGLSTDGSFYIGPSWTPNQSRSKFWVCADTSGETTQPAYFRFDQGLWSSLSQAISYSALGFRANPACVPDDTTLCLNNGRFKVQMGWEGPGGERGPGHAVALTNDTGYFWFFNPANVEAVTKVLDACGLNSSYWVFAGGLTDLETALTVTDTVTGTVRTYRNPQGAAFQPIQDTAAFETCTSNATSAPRIADPKAAALPLPADLPAPEPASTKASCQEGPSTLCLNGGRFRVSVKWRTQGHSGAGQAVRLTGDTGYFWFFDRDNVEVILKILNACGLNDRYWVFAAGLTSVQADITVEDTATGAKRTYTNRLGTPFQPIQDTQGLAVCP